MAQAARLDMSERKVEVNRLKLIETLEANKTKHIIEYNEAMDGYKDALLEKIESGYQDAKSKLERAYTKLVESAKDLNDDTIKDRADYFTLLDSIQVNMKVPRSYEKDYDAAIDIAKWDVNETLELTNAEFTCFVRDQWDWQAGFLAVSAMYNKKK